MGKESLYVLDLETTVNMDVVEKIKLNEAMEKEATFVCASMIRKIGDDENIKTEEFYGRDNAEKSILNLDEGIYYTWNGSRFDTYFIYYILKRAGYKKAIDEKNLSEKEFTYLLAKNKIMFLKFKNEKGEIEIKDACLIFSCSLDVFIKNTCPEFPKLVGTYDYTKYRINEEDFTEEDKKYCRADVKGFAIGLYRIVKEFYEVFNINILDSLTAGSFAMKIAKENIPNYKDYFIQNLYGFPPEFIHGGKTFLNEEHKNIIKVDCIKLDVNSFYPSIMVNDFLPVGKPHVYRNVASEGLRTILKNNPNKYIFAYLEKGVVNYNAKFSPIISIKKGNTFYVNTASHADDIYLDDNILRDEKFEHKGFFKIWIFDKKKGIFDYLNDLYDLKEKYGVEGKKGLRLAVKIILNSTFGKFIQKSETNLYDFASDGVIEKTGEIKKLYGWYMYAPLGAAVTARARYLLTEWQNILGSRFIYSDTDSLIFENGDIPKEFKISRKLGDFDLESDKGRSIYFARKTYAAEVIDKNGEVERVDVTFAGISGKAINTKWGNKITLEEVKKDINNGVTFNVLQGKHDINGIVLIERAKYKKIE